MQPIKNTKKFLISLIEDDLLNSKLIYGLKDLGLYADDYALQLSNTIFKLMGISDALVNEPIHITYDAMVLKVQAIEVNQNKQQLHSLATEIYNYLLKQSRKS
jgi:acetylglutamate synthase